MWFKVLCRGQERARLLRAMDELRQQAVTKDKEVMAAVRTAAAAISAFPDATQSAACHRCWLPDPTTGGPGRGAARVAGAGGEPGGWGSRGHQPRLPQALRRDVTACPAPLPLPSPVLARPLICAF